MQAFYSPGYYLPLPEGHPFPMGKFPEAYDMLVAEGFGNYVEITAVEPCDRAVLELVHDPSYLDAVGDGALEPAARRKLGLPDGAALLERSAREVEGTRLACLAALRDGVSWNLAGGTHHAFPDRGEGFCVLNDVAVAVHFLRSAGYHGRVFVLDTDAHQGNGTHAIFRDVPDVFTYSIHVGSNYPSRKEPGSCDVPLARHAGDAEVLGAIESTLRDAFRGFRPDLAIWISGADPHRNDRFGQMTMTVAGMTRRDAMVSRLVLGSGVPLVVLYGGGYNREVGHTAKLHRNSVRSAIEAAQACGLTRRPVQAGGPAAP